MILTYATPYRLSSYQLPGGMFGVWRCPRQPVVCPLISSTAQVSRLLGATPVPSTREGDCYHIPPWHGVSHMQTDLLHGGGGRDNATPTLPRGVLLGRGLLEDSC